MQRVRPGNTIIALNRVRVSPQAKGSESLLDLARIERVRAIDLGQPIFNDFDYLDSQLVLCSALLRVRRMVGFDRILNCYVACHGRARLALEPRTDTVVNSRRRPFV